MKKKIVSLMLAMVLVLSVLPLGLWAAPNLSDASPSQSSAAYADAPYFYGATKITVPVGQPVDLRSGMFRLMAHDVVDGDITHLISYSPQTVNTSRAGTTLVRYTITNSRGTTTTKMVWITAENRDDLLIERVVHSMPHADVRASTVSGQSRGIEQCTQHLGIYMPPNSSFEIRHLEEYMRLLVHNYSAFAFEAPSTWIPHSGGEWVTISHGNGVSEHGRTDLTAGRIPLVETPQRDDMHTTIEIRFTLNGAGSVLPLDYFHYGDTNQDEFLANWTSDRQLAILASNAVMLMVPWGDRPQLSGTIHPEVERNPRVAIHSINELLAFYNETLDNFNAWNGYTIGAHHARDRLIHARFLVVPAYGGPGYAYASTTHLGFPLLSQTGQYTIYPYLFRSWALLHEMAHLFDGDLARSRELDLVEIVTNVQAHFMQRRFADRRNQWLYGHRTQEEMERDYLAMNPGSFPEGDFEGGLFVLIFMLESSGREYDAWARVQSLNREMMENGELWSVADLFAQAVYDVSGINIVSHLEQAGLFPSDAIRANVSGGAPPILQMPAPITAVPLEERTPVTRPSDTPRTGGVYTIRNQAGRYLAVVNGELRCSATNPSRWFLRQAENGGYYIYLNAENPRYRLDLVNNFDIENNRIQIWGGGYGIHAQTWFLEPNGDGSYQIRTVNESGRVLTTVEGTYAQLQTFLWLDTQRWVFEQQ